MEHIPVWPRLSLRDLEIVLAIADTGSTVGAASVLHLAQPSVSRALAQAERRLGVALFDRTAKGLTMTANGAVLARDAAAVVTRMLELEATVSAPPCPTAIRLAATCPTVYRWLPSATRALRARRHDLSIDLCALPVVSARVAFGDDLADAVLTTEASGDVDGELVPVTSDETVLVLNARHTLASRPSLRPSDLRAYPLLLPTQMPEHEQPRIVHRLVGRNPSDVELVRLPLTEAILDVVRSGNGVAALSEWIVDAHSLDGLVVKRPSGAALRRSWSLVIRPEMTADLPHLAAALASVAPPLHPRRSNH